MHLSTDTALAVRTLPGTPLQTSSPISPSLHQLVSRRFPKHFVVCVQAALASLRCATLALFACLFCRFDLAVVDIVSLSILVLALFRSKSLFYCHYPDKLLAQSLSPHSQQSLLKRIYRTFVDALEAFSLWHATRVACNSRFTSNAFTSTCPKLSEPCLIYPCVSFPNAVRGRNPSNLLLSLNRYERKKNVLLAVETLAYLRAQHDANVRLVIAGGYETRHAENVNYFEEIRDFFKLHKLQDHVTILKNISDEHRRSLFREALVLLYTPSNEHFGIVPLEAMGAGVPIIAVNSGCPLETVDHLKFGFLCKDSAEEFRRAVLELVRNPQKSIEMDAEGRRRVESDTPDVLQFQQPIYLCANQEQARTILTGLPKDSY